MKKVNHSAGQNSGRGNPWPAALRILSGRDHSQAELRKRLTDKGFDAALVEETLQRCRELGYLDDARYARARAISLMNRGRAVGHRVLADLRQHGVSQELAEEALAAARESCDEDSLLGDLLVRRFPGFDFNTAPARDKRRVVNFLQRRGFATDRILDHLKRKGSATDHDDR